MSGIDPYQAPMSDLEGPGSEQSSGCPLTENMVTSLSRTRPWVKFLSILGFIGSGFMVLGALAMFVMGVSGAAQGSSMGAFSGVMGVVMAVVYLVIAAVYIMPCLSLYRYGAAIENLCVERDVWAFEAAVMYQKNFWRIIGIMTAVMLGLYLLFIVFGVIAMIVAGAAAAM